MNFKEWLLISEEEEKDINLSNPNLTSTIPPLNKKEKKSNDKIIEIAKHYIEKNDYPHPVHQKKLAGYLEKKRQAYKYHAKDTKHPDLRWYPSDIEVAKAHGLPNNWMLRIDFEKKSNQKIKELAYHVGRNGKEPSTIDSNEKYAELGKWLSKKKAIKNQYELSDNKTWADMVKLSKTKNWIDPVTGKRFIYQIPESWRKIPTKRKTSDQERRSKRMQELAYYYGENGTTPSQLDHNKEIKSLGRWLSSIRTGTQSESDDTTWAEMVASSKTWDKKKFPYKLPDDWRDIEPDESVSGGEKLVGKTLEKLKFNAIHQYRDKGCDIITGRCLRFDYSFEYKDQEYFVEYHGVQHYYPVYFGSTEGMTKKQIAKHALAAFEVVKKSDLQKYNYCKEINNKFPLLVIPYWISSNKIKYLILSFIKHYNEFNEFFANPDVPDENEKEHTRMLNMKKCFASGKLNCKELFKKQKTTFEQFLIGKNFTYFNA